MEAAQPVTVKPIIDALEAKLERIRLREERRKARQATKPRKRKPEGEKRKGGRLRGLAPCPKPNEYPTLREYEEAVLRWANYRAMLLSALARGDSD